MLADFVLKGIDNLFNQKLALQPRKKIFTKDIIKQNLQNVVRRTNTNIQQTKQLNRTANLSPLNKSRLRSILEHNKQEKIRSVVKRNKNDRSSSPSPYTKIERTPTKTNLQNSSLRSCQSMSQIKKDQNLIVYYREQRKNMDKSRITQKTTVIENKKQNILRQSYLGQEQKTFERQPIRVPSYKKLLLRN